MSLGGHLALRSLGWYKEESSTFQYEDDVVVPALPEQLFLRLLHPNPSLWKTVAAPASQFKRVSDRALVTESDAFPKCRLLRSVRVCAGLFSHMLAPKPFFR